jgi:hypothetical protein
MCTLLLREAAAVPAIAAAAAAVTAETAHQQCVGVNISIHSVTVQELAAVRQYNIKQLCTTLSMHATRRIIDAVPSLQ